MTLLFPEYKKLLGGWRIGHVDTEEMRVHSQAGFNKQTAVSTVAIE